MKMLLPQQHRKGREGLLLPPTPQCPAMTALMEFGWKLAARDTCEGQCPVLSEQGKGHSNWAKNQHMYPADAVD